MKNISYIINGVLAMAIVVLFYLHFADKKNGQPLETISSIGASNSNSNSLTAPVVFINSDSLLNNYTYFHQIRKEMETKSKNAEADLMRRQKSLQAELQKYQETGGGMSMDQRQKVEESLQKKDMELRNYSQTLSQNLQIEEAKLTEDLFNKLSN